MKLITSISFVFFTLFCCVNIGRAQSHAHLNIGAVGTTQGAPLTFDNGVDFATGSDYVKTLTYTNAGKYAGLYAGNITLTVLAATIDYGGPIENAPALGSHINVRIVSVEGPAGGTFGFWETGSTAPTFSVMSGTTSTNSFGVSQTDGSPGVDPFGHIHGRQFTATKPGIYVVSLQAFDVSTNGENGGPIHSESDILKIYFQAGINVASIHQTESGTDVRVGTLSGQIFNLEATDDLANPDWKSVSSTTGDDHFQLLNDPTTATNRFYRIRVTTP